MTLVKRRQYGTINHNPLAPLPLTVDTGVILQQSVSPGGTHATFLRGRFELSLGVAIGLPTLDIPPEKWWIECEATLYVYFVNGTSTALQPSSGTSELYLGSQVLSKTLVASPSQPDEYYVTFFTEDALEIQTARKFDTAVTGPAVNVWLYVHDPNFVFAGGYTATEVNSSLRYFFLWGSPT